MPRAEDIGIFQQVGADTWRIDCGQYQVRPDPTPASDRRFRPSDAEIRIANPKQPASPQSSCHDAGPRPSDATGVALGKSTHIPTSANSGYQYVNGAGWNRQH